MQRAFASLRFRLVPRAAALGLVAAALCLGAAPGEPAAAAVGESTLEDVMKGLKAQLKQLSSSLDGKKQDSALAAVGEMERLVLLAKTHEPANLNDTPKDGRPAKVVAFRKDLLAVLRELADVEVDILDEKYDAAAAKVSGPLTDMRDEGHDKYRPKQSGR